LAVVHFYASWAESCGQVNKVLEDLKEDFKNINSVGFSFIEAEGVPEVSAKYSIVAAPTVLYFVDGKEVDRVNGYKPSELEMKLTKHSFDVNTSAPAAESRPKEDLNTRLKKLINSHKLMLFMKGSPENPKCGFSKQTVGLLNDIGADFGSFDILSDEEVRQGLKEYSNWPTYPQLYFDGELIGGLDVIREEFQDSEFVAKLPKKEDNSLPARLKRLINSHKLMLFMKGDRHNPQCGFSRQIIELLNGVKADYGTFDILKDEEVRQGLKLYLNGELLGGLDVVRAELADEEFVSSLPKTA
uniref:Glutaredoxin-3 n=1 Tax=Nippostrongylus brasiliensis TaxID=27835 RepID=A0A0N4YM99_NIPBR